MKKAATYVRVSNHPYAQESLSKQKEKISEYCKANGYQVEDTVGVIGDRKTGYPMLMDLLSSAKEKGIDTIVMASANRIVGSIDELNDINQAFFEAGVDFVTMDGSHNAVSTKDLIATFLARAGDEVESDLSEEDTELVFGYDIKDGKLEVNESEFEVVKYIFARRLELTTDMPLELIQEVIDDYSAHGQTLSVEEAKRKVPESRISALIESEVKEKWPAEYESMIRKQEHNKKLMLKTMFARSELPNAGNGQSEPILNRDEWEAAQRKFNEAQDEEQGLSDMKMQ